jgi:radical SAM additional 4Fe4S-binding domain
MEYAKNKGLKNVDLISTTTGTDSCEAFFRNGYVINYDGNVYKCAMCIEDKKNNCIGYISKSGEMIIDLSKERKWLKREYIEEKCKKCIYLPMCIMNRCHYSSKIHGKTKCIEYKDLIESQIISMIVQHKYLDIYRR